MVIPGFGSLKVTESKGSLAGESPNFEPPGKTVVFTTHAPAGDERLPECYARISGTAPEEARQQVLELADAIRFAFDKGETYILTGVGLFSRNDDNEITFTRDAMLVVDPGQYGLSSLDLLELDPEIPEPEAAPVVQETRHTEPEPVKRVSEPGPSRRSKRWKVIWIVTGSLLVVLVVLTLIPTDWINGIGTGENTGKPREPKDQIEQPGKTGQEQAQQPEELPDEALTGDEEQQAVQETTEETPGFYIIAGSFKNLQNATELQDKLTSKGFPAEIIYTDNRMYRVSVKSYFSKEKAIEELPMVRKSSGLDNAWVLSR